MSFISYLRETKAEMRNVEWPSSRSIMLLTFIVIACSLFFAYFLGGLDIVFTRLIGELIQ